MEEIIRPHRTSEGSGPSGLGDPLAPADNTDAYVASGPYAEQLPVGGMSVGEIRRRYGDRFDLHPESQAILDGNPAAEDATVQPGQMLMFIRRAGEKGNQKICLEGDKATAVSPEGEEATISFSRLMQLMNPVRMDTGSVVLPDGVKTILSRGPVTIWVHETPPRVFNLKWIAADSPARYGSEATYRSVRIALPYLVVLAVFQSRRGGQAFLTQANECFFRTEPLRSLDDKLLYPALLNCSRFDPPEGKPLSWICTQHLLRTSLRSQDADDTNEWIRLSLQALMHCLLETGFNYSSDVHEAASWFSESTGQDKRIATIEQWEQETAKDPNFVLDVPWLEVGMSLAEVTQRIFQNLDVVPAHPTSVHDLARLIFNSNGRSRTERVRQTILELFA
jgi:hypothetical protein